MITFVNISGGGPYWLFDSAFYYFLIACYIFYQISIWVYNRSQASKRKADMIYKGQKCKAARDFKVKRVLEKYAGQFPPKDRQDFIIEEYNTLYKLREALDRKQLTSKELVLTYVQRAATIGIELNACADVMFEEAIQASIQADADLEINNKKGFLHGIPISFKEQIFIKNTLSTMGTCAMSDQINPEDGIIAYIIRKNGGIPFVKTNLPQMLGMPESLNRVFGNIKNPHNHERVAGGSSGGEASLLAANCSPIGIGTDAAGSIRIPSNFCGIYGFKPSVKRMTRRGNKEGYGTCEDEGKSHLPGTTGPMGHNLDDLIEMMKVFLSKDLFEKDILIPEMPFNMDILDTTVNNKDNLKLGYFNYDGLFYPCKTVRRAMDETVKSCEQFGIEMIPIDITKLPGFVEGFGKLMLAGSKTNDRLLDGEPPMIEDDPGVYIEMIPSCIKPILVFILEKLGMRRETVFLKCIGDYSLKGYSEGVASKGQFVSEFDKLMKENELDGFICPVTGTPAFKHYESKELSISVVINVVTNLLDCAGTSIPVTKVTSDDLKEEYDDINFPDDHFVKETRKSLENSEGMPVGIQVCTRTFQEEKCLGISKLVDDALKQYNK